MSSRIHSGNQLGIESKPVNYYYEKYWVLGRILGKKSKSSFSAWVRFALVLSVWIIALGFLSLLLGIHETVRSKDGFYDVVGYFNDGVMVAFCAWLFAGVAVLLVCIKKFDDALISMAHMFNMADSEKQKQINRLEKFRETVSLRTKKSKYYYYGTLLLGTIFVLAFNTVRPWISDDAHSWAIAPRYFPMMWFIGNFWALFYIVFVFGNMLWFIGCTIAFPLRALTEYAISKQLSVPTIADDGKGGIKPFSALAFYLMLLPSGGIAIEIQWALTFPKYDDGIEFLMIVYSIFLASIYVIPMWALRNAMKTSKEENLKALGLFLSPAFLSIINQAKTNIPFSKYCASNSEFIPASEISGLAAIYQRVEATSINPASKLMNIAVAFVSTSPYVLATRYFALKLEGVKDMFGSVWDFIIKIF